MSANVLPQSWVSATLEECVSVITKGTTPTSVGFGFRPEGIRFVKVENLRAGRIDLESIQDFVDESTHEALRRSQLRGGDVLFSIAGTIGRTAIVFPSDVPANTNQAIAIIRCLDQVLLPDYLRLFLHSPLAQLQAADNARGGAMSNVSLGDIQSLKIPLAPLLEQTRIVEKTEELLTDLDSAVEALKRVQANLKRYRASVLKAACEGRLVPTEAEVARKEVRTYESGEQLLARILNERRAKWEADQLAKMLVAGNPRNDDWKKKYREPTGPDITNLPELPEGWTWANIDIIADTVGGLTKGQKRTPSDVLRSVPYLRVANVQRGYLDLSEIKEIDATEDEIAELRLQPDDILFNEGGDRDKLGRGWIWEGQIKECIHQNHVYRARLICRSVEPRFVSHFTNSQGQRYFLDEGKQTTNLASINLTKLRGCPVPLPPGEEQNRIVTELHRQLDYVDSAVGSCIAGLKRADRLRQAILKRAFEGKLVPQDPNDEPASVLLERIRVERTNRGTAKQRLLTKGRQLNAQPVGLEINN
jgi:type I restriction enzyme S subunit